MTEADKMAYRRCGLWTESSENDSPTMPPTTYSPRKVAEVVIEVIDEKYRECQRQGLYDPHYIKMPIWIFSVMKDAHDKYNNKYLKHTYGETQYYYQDLQVCPTYAIFVFSQIEVF